METNWFFHFKRLICDIIVTGKMAVMCRLCCSFNLLPMAALSFVWLLYSQSIAGRFSYLINEAMIIVWYCATWDFFYDSFEVALVRFILEKLKKIIKVSLSDELKEMKEQRFLKSWVIGCVVRLNVSQVLQIDNVCGPNVKHRIIV